MRYRIVENGIYKHFKGGRYAVICTASDSKCHTYVVYADKNGQVYARPIEMFFSTLSKEQYPEATQVTRFEYIDEMVSGVTYDTTDIIHTEDPSTRFTLRVRESGSKILVRRN